MRKAQVEWESYHSKKDNWQHITIERIRNDLLMIKDNTTVHFDAVENHLAIVYGRSQVGKTTLILTMIGIKDQCFKEVYDTLRGGISKGNASTSTAIIYSQSPNEQYGCAVSEFEEQASKAEYFDKNGMIEKLMRIRCDVENNKRSTNLILHIQVPHSYFKINNNNANISIMDMPGVGSRNEREQSHVLALMNRYLPIASICMVVTAPDQLSWLINDGFLKQEEWLMMNHKFILIIAMAFSNGTAKEGWRRSGSKGDYYEYIMDFYKKAALQQFGKGTKTEVYPMEAGESLAKLCESNPEKDIFLLARDRILDQIRDSIMHRRGEKLKTIIVDLQKKVERSGEIRRKRIEYDISRLEKEINQFKTTLNKSIEQCSKLYEKLTNANEEFSNSYFEQNLAKIAASNVWTGSEMYNEVLKVAEKTASLIICSKKNGDMWFHCKDELIKVVYDVAFSKTLSYIKSQKEWICDLELTKSFDYIESLAGKVDEIIYQYVDIISTSGFLKKKIYLDKLYDSCIGIIDKINKLFINYKADLSRCIVEKKNRMVSTIVSLEKEISDIEHFIKCQENEITTRHKQIEELQDRLAQNASELKQDNKTLNMYMKYAEQAYLEQRNAIIETINNSHDPEDSFMNMLLLGLIDEDYNRIREVANNGF